MRNNSRYNMGDILGDFIIKKEGYDPESTSFSWVRNNNDEVFSIEYTIYDKKSKEIKYNITFDLKTKDPFGEYMKDSKD
tara:strand:- start:377 stop:613 length:237 start_codon:yes stop_codon:yes gene_type:complete